MLELVIPAFEYFDEKNETFISGKASVLTLEHSLLSLSRWESKWHVPFFSDKPKTKAQSIDYVRCMTINRDVDPMVYMQLTDEHFKKINEYMDDPMTATWFSEDPNKKNQKTGDVITSEIIYWQMISFRIPPEYQKWHLNRLITLIRICSIKSEPPKKMSRKELLARNRALNASRRKKLNTRG